MGNFVTSSPNEALLISGPRGTRVAVGETRWRWAVVEQTARISLEVFTLELLSNGAETSMGVRVNVKGVAQVKVNARTNDANMTIDKKSILLAAQHFLGDDPQRLMLSLRQTLEGEQRSVIAQLTVEQLYKDRAAFSQKVREHVHDEVEALGFVLLSYSLISVDTSDNNEYMLSLGATQSAIVKRDAAEGRAKNEADAKIKVAQAESSAAIAAAKAAREAHVVRNQQLLEEIESDQVLELKRADIASRTGEAREKAEASARIEKARQEQEVVRQRTQQIFIEKEVQTRIAAQEAERVRLEMQGAAAARLAAQEADAKALLVKAEAEANRIRLIAQADADAIRMKGEAEAATLRLKAEAYAKYGDAALSVLVIEKLPEIAKAICAPLEKTDKMVFVSAGGAGGAAGESMGGPSLFTRDVTGILGQLPAAVEALTGFDLQRAIANAKAGGEFARGGVPKITQDGETEERVL